MDINFITVAEKDLTNEQQNDIKAIQKICFSSVSDEEVREDFYDPPVIRVLAYNEEMVVGYADVHLREHVFQDETFLLGGPSGFCVKKVFRKEGIGTKLCELAMDYLIDNKCDIAFLSVAKDSVARSLYRKFGFVDLPFYYSWKKSNAGIGRDDDGMIAPVCNKILFNKVLDSLEDFYVGEGYW